MKGREIDKIVSKIMKIKIERIRSKGGKGSDRKESEARYIAMHLRNKYLKQSYNKLAKEWGYTNHTVTMHGIKNVRNHIETEKQLAVTVSILERMVELRLKKVVKNKRRYNNNLYLKQKGITVKNEIASADADLIESLSSRCQKKLQQLAAIYHGVQYELSF